MKKITLIIMATAWLVSGCVGTKEPKESEIAQSRYNLLQGVNYYTAKQYSQAQEAINKSLSINPENPQTHLMSALINDKLGFKQRTENAFLKALSFKPVSTNILNNYANYLCEDQEFTLAESYFEQAASAIPNKSPEIAFTNAGLCAIKSGQPDKAEIWFNKALANNPSQGTSLYQLAILELESQRILEANALLNQFLKHRKHTAKTLLLGARIEKSLGNNSLVDHYLNKLAIEFPTSNENRQAKSILNAPAGRRETTKPLMAPQTIKKSSSGKDWISNRSPNHYTLQIMATKNPAVVDQLNSTLQAGWHPVKYSFNRNGETWYTLIEGDYADTQSARDSLTSLPAEIKKYRPWIRHFESIQRVISQH